MSLQLSNTASQNAEKPDTGRAAAEPAHYGYIDALRGVAILGVFVVHSSQHVPQLPERFLTFCDAGQFGVQLFFVLSALTLLLSFHGRRPEKQNRVRNFYLRRFFRIAPMFWFGILLYNYTGLHPNYFAPGGIHWWQVLATFAFVHGWYPTSIDSVVPGGWSIAVETTFYAIFPLLAIWLVDKKRVGVVLIVALIFVTLLNHFLLDYLRPFWLGHREPVLGAFLHWWFPSQFPVFLIGFLLYYGLKNPAKAFGQTVSYRRRAAFVYVFGAWLLILILINVRAASLLPAGYAAAFALLVYGLALIPFRLFVNRFFRYLGLISFSGYIDHFLVLNKEAPLLDAGLRYFHLAVSPILHYGLLCSIALPSTIALATITYRLIEVPGINLGKKLIIYLDARTLRSTASPG